MIKRMACLGLAAALVAACVPAASVEKVKVLGPRGDALQISIMAYAGGNRDLRTIVVGNPFGGPKTAFDAAVTAAMHGVDQGLNINYTTTPGPSARPGYFVVVVFNPAPTTEPDGLCRSPDNAKSGPAETGRLVMLAVFCGDKPYGAARGVAGAVSSASDPEFVRLVRGVARELRPDDPDRPNYGTG
jgi:hypothetical protein